MLKDNLIMLRKQNGYTQADVANRLCVSRQAYNHYETGVRIPPTDTLQELATIFRVTTDFLLEREETPQKNTHLSNEDKRVLELFQEYPELVDIISEIATIISTYSQEEAEALIAFLKARRNP